MALPATIGGKLIGANMETAITRFGFPVYTGHTTGEIAGLALKRYVLN